jgi:isoamylase
MQGLTVRPGLPAPLGSTVQAQGVNFALASSHAQAVDLCVFDAQGTQEIARLRLPGNEDGVFHGLVQGCTPGMLYGYRVHGPHAPEQGHRFNAYKLLLDPYAREIAGQFAWHSAHFDNPQDNAAVALKARVVVDLPAVPVLSAPRIAANDMVLYELHVKGFSQRNAAVPAALRGTYAGLAHAASIEYLHRLGVTSVCLLPVHFALDEQALAQRSLSNYWGYNTLGFFAPAIRYAAQPAQVREEFAHMVRTLQAAGIEVILDVVFNHTAESDGQGPLLSWRGIDNAVYYRLAPHQAAHYENLSGCGNTLNTHQPRVLQFVLDSLRYWVGVMGVDGFRFDLAATLGETAQGFDAHAALFQAIAQDPLLAHTKLIAEPWHAGAQGYQLGRFPARWMQWNDKFRDTARRFWLRRDISRGEFAQRFMASADVFNTGGQTPQTSINYVCAHDGLTLRDMVSYSHKHNYANGEDNRDGRNGEISHAHGVEGDTQEPSIVQARLQHMRTVLATLLLAQGVPMLRAGDELFQTQQGNNNAYCQDNEISWIDWGAPNHGLPGFVAQLIALRKRFALLRQQVWFSTVPHAQAPDAQWFTPDSQALHAAQWNDAQSQAFALLLRTGSAMPHEALWIALNPGAQAVLFQLPPGYWQLEIDYAQPHPQPLQYTAQGALMVAADNIVLFSNHHPA